MEEKMVKGSGGAKKRRGRDGVKKEGGHKANLLFQKGEEQDGMRKEKGAALVSNVRKKRRDSSELIRLK